MKSFKTSIDGWGATFTLKEDCLVIEFRSIKEKQILLARYTQDSIPEKLHNVIDTLAELYEMLENISKENLRLS